VSSALAPGFRWPRYLLTLAISCSSAVNRSATYRSTTADRMSHFLYTIHPSAVPSCHWETLVSNRAFLLSLNYTFTLCALAALGIFLICLWLMSLCFFNSKNNLHSVDDDYERWIEEVLSSQMSGGTEENHWRISVRRVILWDEIRDTEKHFMYVRCTYVRMHACKYMYICLYVCLCVCMHV
jgi:hypothetical protein